jgi:hypothetical protein
MVQGRAIGTNIAAVLAKVEKDLEAVRDEFLKEVAEDLVSQTTSPIWSGQYITSHSISTSPSAGQFTSNIGGWSERTTNPSAYRAEARANLMGDIAALPPNADKIYIQNNAPHARIVEFGGGRTPAYAVFSSVSNRAGLHLQTAINKVKGSQ